MPDEAPQSNVLKSIRSASGGVNTFDSPLDIRDDQCVDMTNGYAPGPGVLRVRPGSSIVATGVTWGPVLAMSEYTPSSYTPELLIVTPGATYPNAAHLKLWKWDGTGSQFTLMGTLTGLTAPTLPVDIITGLDLNAPGGPAVAQIRNRQPLDFFYVYAGAALTLATGGAPSTGMFPFGTAVGRGFAAGRPGTARGKIFYSDVASYTVTGMNTNQSFTMGGGTRQEIVALKEFRSSDLIAFLSDRIEMLQLDGDPLANLTGSLTAAGLWSRVVVDKTIGCCSRRTVQTVGEDLFFCDQYGNVRSLNRTITDNNQGTKSLPVSAAVQTFIDRINPNAFDTIVAASYDRYYVVSFPLDNAVTPSHTLVYDTINKAWYGPWDGPWARTSSLTVATLVGATSSSDRNPTLYIGGAETGNAMVYRAFTGNGDSGSAITLQEVTKRESYGTLDRRKRGSRLRVYALPSAGATLMVECRPNGGAYRFLGYMDMSGESPQLPLTGPIDFTGAGVVEGVFTIEGIDPSIDFQARFTATASSDLQLLGYTWEALIDNVDDTVKPLA